MTDRIYIWFAVITMNHGGQHRLEHTPFYLDGVDCYKIEKELLDA